MQLTFAKAAAFEGAGLQNWDTTSVTNMGSTFERTGLTTVDLSKWDVSKVTNMGAAFLSAAKFTGTGLDQWSTDALVNLKYTFYGAAVFNTDLSKWGVSTVTDMGETFRNAYKFEGVGLDQWSITAALTALHWTFTDASEMNADLRQWDISQVTTMENAFFGAAKFTGAGLSKWSTDAVTTLKNTFKNAGLMNVDVGGWIVSKVTDMTQTFENAAAFTGTGLRTWNVGAVTSMALTFNGASSITSCNKRLVFDAWAVVYDAGWASETCTVRPCDLYIMFTA